MENKKQYIKPELKSVEFKVELGFAASQTVSSYGNWRGRQPADEYTANPGNGGRFGGFFTGNNDDWD